MTIAIVAATGGIGRHVLDQALKDGHHVRVVVRQAKGPPGEGRVALTDLTNPDMTTLQSALCGADAVVSGLGAADAGVACRGTRAIVDAMTAVAIRRIVVVSAAPIGTVPSPGRPHPPRHDPG